MRKKDAVIRETPADMFDILSYKIRNGALSMEDAKDVLSIIESGGGIRATVKDLAGFYGQSEDNVRHIIHRHFMPAPERKVYYDFGAFRDAVPEKWHQRHSLPAD